MLNNPRLGPVWAAVALVVFFVTAGDGASLAIELAIVLVTVILVAAERAKCRAH
jgi:hypothetical protein